MSRNKIICFAISLIFLSLTFVSCKNEEDRNVSSFLCAQLASNAESMEDMCVVRFSPEMEKSRGSIVPAEIAISDFSKFHLTLTPVTGGGILQEYDYTSAEEIKNTVFTLNSGRWRFDLSAYKQLETGTDPVAIAFSNWEEELKAAQEYKITLELKFDPAGKGSYCVQIKYPKNSCNSVSAVLKQLGTNSLVSVSSETSAVIKVKSDSGSYSVLEVSGAELEKGLYYLVIEFKDTADNIISKKVQVVYIQPFSVSSSSELTYENLNTPYTITYFINGTLSDGAEWDPSFTPITTFNSSTKLDFASYTSNLKYNNHTFAGWYKDAEYTEPLDLSKNYYSEDLTLYARWAWKDVYIDVTSGSDLNSGDSADSAIKTVAEAVKRFEMTEEVRHLYVCSGPIFAAADLENLSSISGSGGHESAVVSRYSETSPINFSILRVNYSDITISGLTFDGGAEINFTDEKTCTNSGKSSSKVLLEINSANFVLKDSVIQNYYNESGTAYDGTVKAAVNCSETAVIENCSIKNCFSISSCSGLFFSNISGKNLTLKNTNIENNYIASDSAARGAGLYLKYGNLILSGKNYIRNNYKGINIASGTKSISNLRFDTNTSKFIISDNIEGSVIFFNKDVILSDENTIVFTQGYGAYNTADPADIFSNETNYIITEKDGEARFDSTNGTAQINVGFDSDVSFYLSQQTLKLDGSAHTISVGVKIDGTDYSDPSSVLSNFEIKKIYYFESEISSAAFTDNSFVIPAGYPVGNYTIYITGQYKNTVFDANLILTVTE